MLITLAKAIASLVLVVSICDDDGDDDLHQLAEHYGGIDVGFFTAMMADPEQPEFDDQSRIRFEGPDVSSVAMSSVQIIQN